MPELVATQPAWREPDTGVPGAAIGAVGIALPAHVRRNAGIAARLGVAEEWIVARTGVRERRVAAPGEDVVTLASEAARRSLAAAGLDAAGLDLVLLATISHEQLMPAAAPLVAERIGAHSAGALDLNAACSGFVSGVSLAAGQIEAGRARAALVVGADVLSRLTDHEDRSTAALFGDGAGAVTLTRASGVGGVGPAVLGADGTKAGLVTASRAELRIRMKGHDTFRQAVDRLAESTLAAADAAGVGLAEIDAFVYHQANTRILTAVGERLGLDPGRVVDCIGEYGNTSAATVPLALADAEARGLVVPGSNVLLGAFGAGLTWAATVVQWGLGRGDGGRR